MSQEPLFWYRPRSDGGYEGPLHNGQIDAVRKASGAWAPLFAGAAPVSAEPVAWQYFSTVRQDWCQVDHGRLDVVQRTHRIRPLYAAPVAAQAQPEAEERPCHESDGCPTELAVLQRFWREHQQPASGAGGLVRQLCDALELARDCHGVMLMSDPPQEMWKGRGVDLVISEALEAAKAQLSGNPGQLDHLPDATKMVEPSGNARHLADNTRVGILADSSYINGLRTGYVLGQAGNEAEYQKIIGATRAQISEARADSEAQPSGNSGELPATQTQGMTLGQRIAHVGGRENAQGYVEFGSPMAVHALIQHVLRDFHRQGRVNIAPAQQDADKVDAERWRTFIDNYDEYGSVGFIDGSALKAVIDAARKEQA